MTFDDYNIGLLILLLLLDAGVLLGVTLAFLAMFLGSRK